MSAVTAAWIVSGITSPDEASRVLGGRFWRELCLAHDREVTTLPPLATTARTRGQELPDILTVVTDADQEAQLRSALDAIGLRLSVASTVDEAIAKLHRESSIRMLLLDVDQPGFAARPLLRQLRASFTWAGLPFLLLLRENDTATGELLESYGVSDYLYKPFNPEEFQARIRAILTR
ncbi:MAG TPA: response regulator, partial [Gammaproteobacteria bacterium]